MTREKRQFASNRYGSNSDSAWNRGAVGRNYDCETVGTVLALGASALLKGQHGKPRRLRDLVKCSGNDLHSCDESVAAFRNGLDEGATLRSVPQRLAQVRNAMRQRYFFHEAVRPQPL